MPSLYHAHLYGVFHGEDLVWHPGRGVFALSYARDGMNILEHACYTDHAENEEVVSGGKTLVATRDGNKPNKALEVDMARSARDVISSLSHICHGQASDGRPKQKNVAGVCVGCGGAAIIRSYGSLLGVPATLDFRFPPFYVRIVCHT